MLPQVPTDEATLECPACGGAGGGPLGRAGSAWDDEAYVCPRCAGTGVISASPPRSERPGIAKVAPAAPLPKKRAAGDGD